MILSFYYLKIAVSLDISALYHSKIQTLFYILFNAGVSNFDINKSHPQWGLSTESSSATDYRYFMIPFNTKPLFSIAASSKDYLNWINIIDNTKFLCGYMDDWNVGAYVPYFVIGKA